MFRVLSPIGKALRAFFVSDLRVRRGDSGLQLVLEEEPKEVKTKRRRKGKHDLSAEKDTKDLERIQISLAALLDQLPENRAVLRHLAFIEHALEKKGLRALHKVPYDVLQHALQQFEGVVVNWSDDGLACLRSKMAVTLIEREGEAGDPAAAPTSMISEEPAPLAVPVTLEGAEADEAEAALLAAYGAAALPGLDDVTPAAPAASPAPAYSGGTAAVQAEASVEVQGELNSPSARALVKSAKAQALREKVELRLRELQQ